MSYPRCADALHAQANNPRTTADVLLQFPPGSKEGREATDPFIASAKQHVASADHPWDLHSGIAGKMGEVPEGESRGESGRIVALAAPDELGTPAQGLR